MKKFNLEAALNGEPVKLQNGVFGKGIQDIPNAQRDPIYKKAYSRWYNLLCFREWLSQKGMWEDPKISIEDLPKPFTPEETQHYYYINGGYVECEDEFAARNEFDKRAVKNGNCFRTREDAQKWLDFMKSIME